MRRPIPLGETGGYVVRCHCCGFAFKLTPRLRKLTHLNGGRLDQLRCVRCRYNRASADEQKHGTLGALVRSRAAKHTRPRLRYDRQENRVALAQAMAGMETD